MLEYDEESDCIYFKIGKLHAFETVEISRNVVVDLAKKGGITGVEIIGASRFISRVFARKVSAKSIKSSLKMAIRNQEELVLDFNLNGKSVSYAIPKQYVSPIVAAGS